MKVICVGRNYVNHAKELNNPIPDQPLIFMKPESALLLDNGDFHIPSFSSNIHYEVELVVKLNRTVKNISEEEARHAYNQVALGIDFTARDIQSNCKDKRWPWELAKAFDHSAAVSSFISVNGSGIDDINFELSKNDEIVQRGNSKDMIFSCEKLISFCSQYFTLNEGDLLFTGTPAGVGPVAKGDFLKACIDGNCLLTCQIK